MTGEINGSLNMIGYGLAAIGPGVGIGLIFAAYINGVARQPEARGTLQQIAILGFALAEALAIIGIALAFVLEVDRSRHLATEKESVTHELTTHAFFAAEEEEHAEPNPLAPHLAEIILAIVVFLILVWMIRKWVMPNFEKTFAARTAAIEGGLEQAEKKQAEADAQLAELNKQLSEARHEAARIREDAREQGAQIVAEMREQAQAESARITGQRARPDRGREAAGAQPAQDRGGHARHRSGRSHRRRVARGRGASASYRRALHRRDREPVGRAVLMRGISAEGYAESVERLEAVAADGDAAQLGNELFAVAGVLGREPSLRRALTDPSAAGEAKSSLARGVFGDKLGQPAQSTCRDGSRGARWSSTGDFVDAIEQLGALALVDRRREVRPRSATSRTSCSGSAASSPVTRSCATRSPTAVVPVEHRQESGARPARATRSSASASSLAVQAVASRHRSFEAALEEFQKLVADRQRRLVAVVRSAVELDADQTRAAGRRTRHPVRPRRPAQRAWSTPRFSAASASSSVTT